MEDSPFYIGNYSQSGREDLEDLEFNEQVHAVGIGAFYGCPNLSRLVLNKDLNYIAPLAFAAWETPMTAALALRVSKTVSMRTRSAPPSRSPREAK